ncbi:plant intracellular Ras-group-related LRR protein 5-like [Tasmannia lanceolata]|uniref:plant intracellular Ras-group-related LRR protein 5-like n=1 Tax=Tasmannia lanceolata TaxID=3420 RepID=UPI0040643CA2
MAIPPQPDLSAVIETVGEIMRIHKSLPPRPTLDEIEAAMSVLKTIDKEEELKIEEISKLVKRSDIPDELFFVLREVKKNMVLLQSHEQRKEALYLIDLDKRFQTFDDLILRASKLVPVDAQNQKQDGFVVPMAKVGKISYMRDESLIREKEDEREELDVPKGFLHSSSLKVGFSSGEDAEKLSLIKVASLIETSAKNGSKVLDLQGKLMDRIEWLPVSLGKLSDVTDINLSENRIMALPSTINSLKCLTKLDVHSNQLINLPDSFAELYTLVDLDLHGNQLRSLPTTFGNLTNLVNLDLSSNQLSILPETLGNLTSLKRLNVETNEIEELPHTIGSCSLLTELILDFNQLKALPEAIGKLECLEILTMHYNRIKGLPTTMGFLSKLKELDVSFNELESVPENLCFATSLVKLNVGRNFADLRSLPRSIGNLEMLEVLDISNNQIRTLPESFRSLSRLRVLYTDETPLELPPRQVLKLGAQAVVQYMADFVAKKDMGSRPVEKKGVWFWFCSLFRTRSRKNLNKSVDATMF